ncbi:caltrin-like protein 1 [Ursus arctos]|uniref:caltrin-like protein 1 n=1 Tax=Ursus arctos TaxID=9644 RepID=UPI0020180CA4|nr:caltrin-like protein 1 [Ursus arctos]
MSLLSSRIKAIFIIVLVFPLYSETSFAPLTEVGPVMPNCARFSPGRGDCTREWDPVCASDGVTYGNTCIFCREKGNNVYFSRFGTC